MLRKGYATFQGHVVSVEVHSTVVHDETKLVWLNEETALCLSCGADLYLPSGTHRKAYVVLLFEAVVGHCRKVHSFLSSGLQSLLFRA
jgi:hypothetical protein